MKFLQNIHNEGDFDIDSLLKQAFDFGLKHDHLQIVEQKYNQQKLRESRNRARSGRQRRDVSELEQPAFIKKMSMSQPPSQQSDSFELENENKVLPVTPLSASEVKQNDEENAIVNEEKKEETQEEDVEGSHSDSSYAEDEPSSVLPTKEQEHELVAPHQNEEDEEETNVAADEND